MKLAKLSALAVAATFLLSACASGFDAATNTQRASGNGRSGSIGDIEVRGATLVIDKTNPQKASLVATFVNTNATTDLAISKVVIDSTPALGEFPIELPAGLATRIGFNSEIFVTAQLPDLAAGSYQKVAVTFSDNSTLELSLIVNDNTGEFSEVIVPSDSPAPVASSIASESATATP